MIACLLAYAPNVVQPHDGIVHGERAPSELRRDRKLDYEKRALGCFRGFPGDLEGGG